MFSKLAVWCDQEPHTGAENMALDQALLESSENTPILRVYTWSQPTVSFGYFHSIQDVQTLFSPESDEELHFVRRWTGGGVVDHRIDVTYSLIIPRSEEIAQVRGVESYRVIHQALVKALEEIGQPARLREVARGSNGLSCFTNPVSYDLIDLTELKIAGAAQRRSRHGLLHQGSVIPALENDFVRAKLPTVLGGYLSEEVLPFKPEQNVLKHALSLVESRYSSRLWIEKR